MSGLRGTKEWSHGVLLATVRKTTVSGSKKTFHVVEDGELNGLAFLDQC